MTDPGVDVGEDMGKTARIGREESGGQA